MDIEEIKNYARNKIEAGELTKQVRRKIKENTWEKQNQREGFTETFKPLISQFEKPEDPKTKNIFTQNQEMLRNQLALTEGLKANQKAITDGFSQFERLADMQELPGVEAIKDEDKVEDEVEDEEDEVEDEEDEEPKIVKLDIEKNFDDKDFDILNEFNYARPKFFKHSSEEVLEKELKNVTKNIKSLTGSITGRNKKDNPTPDYVAETNLKEAQKETLIKYKKAMLDYFSSIKYKVGEGIYSSPQELIRRFELLNGSLAAGNNGVLPEYIQLAHRLRDYGFINNNQLSTLLRKII